MVIRRHMDALCALKGEERAMREARKHVGWYLHGVRGAAQFRRRGGRAVHTLADLDQSAGGCVRGRPAGAKDSPCIVL